MIIGLILYSARQVDLAENKCVAKCEENNMSFHDVDIYYEVVGLRIDSMKCYCREDIKTYEIEGVDVNGS